MRACGRPRGDRPHRVVPSIHSRQRHRSRRSQEPQAALRAARRTDCTILLVRHLRKREGGRALYRGLGSVGFIAASRTGLFASRHPTDSSQSVLAVMKSNAAVRGQSLGYRIKSDEAGRAVVDWTVPPIWAGCGQPSVRRTRPKMRATAPRPGSRLRPAAGPRKASESTRQPRRRAFPSGRSIGPRPSCTLARESPSGTYGLVLVRLVGGMAEGYALQETGNWRVADGFQLMAE